jgi:hypothetical protein
MFDVLRSLTVVVVMVGAGCAPTTGDGDDDSDSNPDGGGFTSPDGDENPTECEPDLVPMPTTATCAAATRTCIDACTTDACPDSCVAMDPDPDSCGGCLEDGWISCVNGMGCQAQWDAVSCCYEECPDPDSAACEASCASATAAYDACSEAFEDACATSADAVCYP